MWSRNDYLLVINMALFGLFVVPIQPLGLSFCLELTHPCSEAMSNSIILLAAEMVAFSGTYIATALISVSSILCVGFFTAQILLAVILNCYIVEDLRRLKLKIDTSVLEVNRLSTLLIKRMSLLSDKRSK